MPVPDFSAAAVVVVTFAAVTVVYGEAFHCSGADEGSGSSEADVAASAPSGTFSYNPFSVDAASAAASPKDGCDESLLLLLVVPLANAGCTAVSRADASPSASSDAVKLKLRCCCC